MNSPKNLSILQLVGVGALLISLPAAADVAKVDFDHATGSLAFHAVGHPSAIKINGTGACPKGTLSIGADGKIAGELTLDIASLDTGISMRTNHMKEKYLEVEKFPQAKLQITEIALPAGDAGKTDYAEDKVPFQGNLTLHGVTKPVTGTAHIERHGASSSVHAEFAVKITDYAINVPVFAGITVADDVSLEVDAKAPVNP
jgi:polyisoprenoid-binding protein YceI